jgi:hypothetical protein
MGRTMPSMVPWTNEVLDDRPETKSRVG